MGAPVKGIAGRGPPAPAIGGTTILETKIAVLEVGKMMRYVKIL